MSKTRDQIISSIRASLGRGALPESIQADLWARFSEPEQGIRPRFDQDPAERFTEKLESVAGTVTRVDTVNDVPVAIQQYLDQHGLETNVVMSKHTILDKIAWPDAWRI